MEILGVGVPEMLFIVLIALILLGPKEMIAASRTLGRFLRKFITSPTWMAMRKTGEELQRLPTKLVREAGLEELQNEVQDIGNQIKPLDLKRTFNEASVFGNQKEIILDDPVKSATVIPPTTKSDQSSEPTKSLTQGQPTDPSALTGS